MSFKKQIPGLCKLYSFYEETPEDNLDETDVDSYFYLSIFVISQSQHRIVRVIKSSNKKSVCNQVVPVCNQVVCDLKTQQRYILQEEAIVSKKELTH